MTIVQNTTDLKNLARELKGMYAALETAVRWDDKFYKLDFDALLGLPDEYEDQGVVLPTAREVVDTAAAHIEPQFRRVTVPRRNTEDSGTEQAVKLRTFYEALLTYFERRTSPTPYRDAAKHLALHGMGCFKLLYDRTKAPKAPTQGSDESDDEFRQRKADWEVNRTWVMPFTLTVPHPMNVMPDPWHDSPEWVIEKQKMKVGQLLATYPDWRNPLNRRPTTDIEVWEYWDNFKRIIIADGKTVFADDEGNPEEFREHDFGVHPYIFGASGLGHVDAERNPEFIYVGMLRFIYDVLMSESRQYSVADIVLKADAWPERVAEGENASELGEDFEIKPGTVKVLPDGVKINTLKHELVDSMVFNFLGLSSNIISQATAPRVLTGGRVPGTASGFDQQITLSQARIRYKPLATAMEKMLTELCMKAGIMMEKLKVPPITLSVGVQEDEFMKVGGSDWKGHRGVVVQINVLEPEDELRKHQDIISRVAAGVTPRIEAMKEIHPNRDPQKIYRQQIKEEITRVILPMLAQGIAMEAIQELQLDQLIEQVLNSNATPGEDEPGGASNRRPPAVGSREQGVRGSRSDQAAQRQQDLRNNGTTR